jgi:hypothetical protein
VQVLERVRAVQLPLMLDRQVPVRQDVFSGILQQRCGLGEPRTKAP